MKTCVVIYNPNSGHTLKKKNIPLYKKVIEDFGYTVTFIGTKYKGHAREIVSHIGYVDLVMSMGGDGTFNEVVHGNLQRNKRLIMAHIPVGTTNDVGVMFGYGQDIVKNIKVIPYLIMLRRLDVIIHFLVRYNDKISALPY